MSDIITIEESKRLVALERTIEGGMTTFIEVGNALAEIRDARLYRVEHKTFEDYCREKWGMNRAYANHLVRAADAVKSLPPEIATIVAKESQARELAKVEPARREEVVAAAVEATGGKITAKAIKVAASSDAPCPAEEAPDGDIATDEPARPSRLPKYKPDLAMQIVGNAIAMMQTIHPTDQSRAKALHAMISYCKKQLPASTLQTPSPEEPAKRMPAPKIEQGINLWILAKAHLDKIIKEDVLREAALNKAIEYCRNRIENNR